MKAENKYGVSDELESSPEVAKHAFGKNITPLNQMQQVPVCIFCIPLLLFSDVPQAPPAPIVSEISETSCTVHWQSPENDGGSPVSG